MRLWTFSLASLFVASSICLPTAALQSKQIRFEVHEGTSFSAAVSPDGEMVVFDLQGQLWIVPSDGGLARSITDPLDEARLPAWSPNSDRIAFQAYTHDNFHIWTINPDGSDLRQHTFGPYDDREPHWSPDGKSIAFASDKQGNYDIWTLNVDSGEVAPVTDSKQEQYFPAWSPDGERLAYVSEANGRFIINLLRPGTAEEATFESPNPILLPVWNPYADELAFVSVSSTTPFATATVHSLDLQTREVSSVSDDIEDVFPSRASFISEEEVVYTANGKILRRSRSAGQTEEIGFEAVLSVAERTDYPKKDHQFGISGARQVLGVLRPTVSPDGRSIVFTALGDLWVQREGLPAERLTNDAYLDVDAAFSPDGAQIAYLSDKRGEGIMDLYVRNLESGDDRRLTEATENLRMPSWAPDGKSIAVQMRKFADWHVGDLYVVDVESGASRLLHGGEFLPSQASWSPNGRHIVLSVLQPTSARFRKGLNSFLFIDVETGDTRYESPTPGSSIGLRTKHGPVWSPDGQWIAYVHGGVLWSIEVDAHGSIVGTPRRLTNEAADSPSWVGDSESLVFQSYERIKRVYLADGRIEEIPVHLEYRRKSPGGRKVVHAGRVFDGVGTDYLVDIDIIVDENVIVDVRAHSDSAHYGEVIDASNLTVLPGLWETHVHHFVTDDGVAYGQDRLAWGVTSVRDPGADPYEALERRESWDSGSRVGPRMFFSGILEGTRNYYWVSNPIASPAQVDMELERMLRLDFDFVKTYERVTHRLMKRITEFAHAHGLTVASHEIYPAAMFGADVVEHLSTGDKMNWSDRLSYSRNTYADVIGIMRHSDMSIVPTSLGKFRVPSGSPDVLALPQVQPFRGRVEAARMWQARLTASRADYIENESAAISALFDSGIKVGAGTDMNGISGYMLVQEIAYLSESGLGNVAALQSATIRAAEITGVSSHLGSIEPDKLADLIIVDGDPLARITDLYNVVMVIRDGNLYSLEELTTY